MPYTSDPIVYMVMMYSTI